MTRSTTSSFLLLICSVLGTTTLAVGAVTSLTERQCIKASKTACVWVSRPHGEAADAHVVTPCQDEGSKCVFSSTCRVKDVPRDIFHCQLKHGKQNHLKTSRKGHRKRKHEIPEAMLSHVHKRQRRSAEDEEGETQGETQNKEKNENTKGPKRKVPSFFQQLMEKHRSYNAAAFNRGTFIINPMSHQRESYKIQPVRSTGNATAPLQTVEKG